MGHKMELRMAHGFEMWDGKWRFPARHRATPVHHPNFSGIKLMKCLKKNHLAIGYPHEKNLFPEVSLLFLVILAGFEAVPT